MNPPFARTLRGAFGLLAACAGLTSSQAEQVRVHDPVMTKVGDTYYLFSTGRGIPFYTSKDRQSWKAAGRVFEAEPSWTKEVAPGFDGNIWAPDIIEHRGKFYLFYSISAPGKNTSAIGVTINDTLDPSAPNYAWRDQGIVVRSVPDRDLWNAIDAHIVVDEKGAAWMSFGSFWSGLKLFKLNETLTAPAEPQEWHALAKRERSVLVDDALPEPAAIEAPFIFKKGDHYYLFASWDFCCRGKDSTYQVVVGRSKDFRGPYLDRAGKKMTEGGGSRVLQGNPAWPGVGHNSTYTFDGKDYLVFHAYETADRGRAKLKIGEITWDSDGWPTVDPKVLDQYQSVLIPQ